MYNSGGRLIGLSGIIRDLTESKRVEREQAVLASIVNAAEDPIFSLDERLRIISWNQAAGQKFGYGASQAIGRGIELITSADQLPTITDTCKRIADTGAPANFELRYARDDIIGILLINAFPIRSEAGSIIAIAAIGRDITQLKLGEADVARAVADERSTKCSLREEREYSRELMRLCPYPLIVCDENLLLSDVNDRTLKLTGYTRAELIGNRLPLLFDDPSAVAKTLTEALDQGRVDSEFSLFTKNATEILVSLNASAFKSAEAGNSKVLVALRDISEDKRIQRTVLLASALEASAQVIFSINLPGSNIASWSPGAATLFGYTVAEALGHSIHLLVPLERRAEMTQRIQRYHQEPRTEQYETVCLRKGGIPIDVAVTLAPILDDRGAVIAAAVIMQDIRARRRMETELTEARDTAMEAARVKPEFLAYISNEIRSPLNSIIGLSSLLLDTPLSAQQKQVVTDMRDNGYALLRLLDARIPEELALQPQSSSPPTAAIPDETKIVELDPQ
jgi:PAS domain S-box-containing protein